MDDTTAAPPTTPVQHHKTSHHAGKGEINKLLDQDRPAHDWYRFVLSFPPHLVRHYIERFGLCQDHRVLDPFCGTGTTVVECKKLGIPGAGIEANSFAHFAALVKVDWSPDPDELVRHSEYIAESALAQLEKDGIEDNPLLSTVYSVDYPRQNLRTLEPERMQQTLSSCFCRGDITRRPGTVSSSSGRAIVSTAESLCCSVTVTDGRRPGGWHTRSTRRRSEATAPDRSIWHTG